MRKVKKIMALLLTLAMVMGLSLTAFAEGTDWKITISGTGIDSTATVKYGQIIKEDRESTLGWQFASEAIKTDFVAGWNGATNPAGTDTADNIIAALISAGMLENPENSNVELGKIINNAKYTAALEAVSKYAGTAMDVSTGADVSSTGKGLYVVTAEKQGYTYLPMAAYMNSKGENVAVVAKGSKDQIVKTIAETGASVAPGDEVTYTIQQQYLYFAPSATDKTFTITDEITNGTLVENSIKVYLTDTSSATPTEDDLLDNAKYVVEGKTATGFTVNLGGTYYDPTYAGKTVQITYKVTVGDVTTTEPLRNVASSSNGTGTIVETKPVSFKVIKVDGEDNTIKLEDAEFQIYKDVAQGTAGAVALTLEGGNTVYGLPVGGAITTNANGEATVNNLDAQATYYVKETKAPDGYSLNDTAYQLTGASVTGPIISSEEVGGVTYTKSIYTYADFIDITVEDTTLSALPSTGGIGTTIFTIGGCVIMIAAAGLYFASRRKNDAK